MIYQVNKGKWEVKYPIRIHFPIGGQNKELAGKWATAGEFNQETGPLKEYSDCLLSVNC